MREVSKPDDGTTTDKLLEMTVIGEEPDEEEIIGEDYLDDYVTYDEYGPKLVCKEINGVGCTII